MRLASSGDSAAPHTRASTASRGCGRRCARAKQVRERYCFTVWLDGAAVNDDASLFLKRAHLSLSGRDELEAFM